MTTSTRDDRVHPYHARCFVKRLLDVQREGYNDDTHDSRSKGNIASMCRSSSYCSIVYYNAMQCIATQFYFMLCYTLRISSLFSSPLFLHFRSFHSTIFTYIGYARGSVYYYENMEGGHGGAADNKQQAFMSTLYLDFLWNTIGKKWGNNEDEDEDYCSCHSLHFYSKLLYCRQCSAAICHLSSIFFAHW